jgi:C1q domain
MIPDSDRRSPTYTGTGSVSGYAFTFKVFSTSDVQVIVADTNGAESTLPLGAAYTVTLNGDQDNFPGGTVNLTSPLALNYQLVVLGDVAYSQTSQLPTGGSYNATVVERALDRVTILVQQVREATNRVLGLPAIESAPLTIPSATDRASKFLAFDASGNPIAASGTSATGTPISALGETLVSRATAALMRSDLGAAATGGALFTAASKTAARAVLGRHGFRSLPSTSQSVTGTATLLQWGNEQFDSNNDFDAVTNHRFTAPVDGLYCFSCAVGFVFFGAGNVLIELQVNGTTAHRAKGKIDSADDQVNGAWVLSLTAGQTVRVMIGGTVNAGISQTNESHFSGALVG